MLEKIKDYIKNNNPNIEIEATDLVTCIHVAFSTERRAMSLEVYPEDTFKDIESDLKEICDKLK